MALDGALVGEDFEGEVGGLEIDRLLLGGERPAGAGGALAELVPFLAPKESDEAEDYDEDEDRGPGLPVARAFRFGGGRVVRRLIPA